MFKFAILGTVCGLLLSTLAQANEQRWFEVEMIIFSQTPAANLQEQFDFPVTPIRPGRSIDLVTPLYQPDITALLEIIPLCTASPSPLLEQDLLALTAANPAYYFQFANLCIFEPQNKPWLLRNFMQTRYYDNQLPMPQHISALLTGIGSHTNQPYLVTAEALQLTDIATRIKNQADKSLLLHTAWRQVPVTQRRAIASHWYAGENLSDKFDYWGQAKQLADQQNTGSSLSLDGLTTDLNSTLNAIEPNTLDPNAMAPSQTDIISNIEQLLAQLNANSQLPTPKIASETTESNPQAVAVKLGSKVPDHTWQLDGLFKLHLDHYLFVNTEFNLRLPAADSLQTIYVKQSRRVISGEIHYLDHPYLGIIFQIRRFEPAQPNSEVEPEIDLILN